MHIIISTIISISIQDGSKSIKQMLLPSANQVASLKPTNQCIAMYTINFSRRHHSHNFQNPKPRCIPAVYCKNLYNVVERICNPVQCDAAVSHTLLLSLWCHWTYLWPCSHCSALFSLQCTGKAKENGLTWSLWCAGSPRPKCPALAKSAGGHNAEKVDTRADRPAEPG